jgi:hypothetical protein
MVNGKHVKLPEEQLRALTDDLQLQAVVDGVTIDITSASNGDGTVDVTWTVTPATKPSSNPETTHSTALRTPAPTPLIALRDELVTAAQKFGVDQVLLAGIAYAESSLDPTAKSRSSSAFGLFQFLDATWNTVVEQFGSPLNISVADRNDIVAQCLMGAAVLHSNRSALQARLGRPPTDAECYAAHFFGVGTAEDLLSGDRSRSAGDVLGANAPKIISANPAIFLDGDTVRTVDQVLNVLGSRISDSIRRAVSLLSLPVSPAPNADLVAPGTPAPLFGVGQDFLRPAMITTIQQRLDALNSQSPHPSRATLIYNAALACENTLVCPFHDLQDGNLACAFAVNRVVEFATSSPVDNSISTDGLFDSLRTKADEIDAPTPGAIVISPTQGAVHGHVGVVGQNNLIYSNSSEVATMGVFRQNYTVASWTADLADRRGLKLHYFTLR